MTGREVTEHTAAVTRVVDLDTLGAAVRELAVGQDSVTVVVFGKAGAPLGVLRTRTVAELAEAAHVPAPRPAPRAGRRSLDPPAEESPALSPHMRRASDHIGRGTAAW